MDGGVAHRVAKAVERGQVIADIAPGVVGAMGDRHDAGTMQAFGPLDFGRHQFQRLFPGDAHIAGLAAILRVALAIGIEIDALHGIERAVRRIDDGLGVLPVGRERCLARRRQLHALGRDAPGLGIGLVEIDQGGADDLAILHINEERPAVGHVAIADRAIFLGHAHVEPHAHQQHDCLGEPVGKVLGTIHGHLEVFLRVDLVQPVKGGRQQVRAEGRVLEGDGDVRIGVETATGGHPAILDLEPAPDPFVARHDLGDEVTLRQTFGVGGVKLRRQRERFRQAKKNDFELAGCDAHAFLHSGRFWGLGRVGAEMSDQYEATEAF